MGPDFIPLNIPPGIVKHDGPATVGARFVDADKVRFVDGRPEKWGGWEKWLTGTQWHGIVRGMLAFTTKAGELIAVGGSAEKLETMTQTAKANITPLQASGTLTDPFTTTNGSAEVEVADAAHGLVVDQHVIFDGATAVGGITIDGEYQVIEVVDADNYVILHSAAASSGATGGGTVSYEYEIEPGSDETAYGLGWGAGGWGEGTWGTPRSITDSITTDSRHWFISRYGSMVMALPSGGKLYTWNEPNNDARAAVVTNSPVARAFFMTPERYPVLLGAGGTPMKVQWPDRDDITDWTPSATNTANSRTLQGGSRLVAGTPLVEGQSLIWSDSSAFRMQYTGDEFVYATFNIGNDCGLIGPGAFCVGPGGVGLWMSATGFHLYNGAVEPIPNSFAIKKYVFDRLQKDRARKVSCGFNSRFNEVVWLYTSTGSEDGQNDSYVAVCLSDWSWSIGTVTRSAAGRFEDVDGTFIMSGNDLYLYRHDTGTDADGAAMEAFITTGLSGGARNLDLWGFVPDFQRHVGDVTLTVYSRDRPASADYLEEFEQTVSPGDAIEDLHCEGRYFAIKLASDVVGGDFRLGVPQASYSDAGPR